MCINIKEKKSFSSDFIVRLVLLHSVYFYCFELGLKVLFYFINHSVSGLNC